MKPSEPFLTSEAAVANIEAALRDYECSLEIAEDEQHLDELELEASRALLEGARVGLAHLAAKTLVSEAEESPASELERGRE